MYNNTVMVLIRWNQKNESTLPKVWCAKATNSYIYFHHKIFSETFSYFQKSAEIVDIFEAPFKSAISLLPQQLLPSREVKIENGLLFENTFVLFKALQFYLSDNNLYIVVVLFQVANIFTKSLINITAARVSTFTFNAVLNRLSIILSLNYSLKLFKNHVSMFCELKYHSYCFISLEIFVTVIQIV